MAGVGHLLPAGTGMAWVVTDLETKVVRDLPPQPGPAEHAAIDDTGWNGVLFASGLVAAQ